MLARWARDRGVVSPPGAAAADQSHYLMSGGMYCVPPALADAFLEVYARALAAGEHMYVVERKTPVFHMLAEFDILARGGGELSPEDTAALARLAQGGMEEVFGSEGLGALVLRAPPKKRGDVLQTGIHIIWDVPVTRAAALVARTAMLRRLRTLEIDNPWEDAFDPCVYKENGLRMLGSRKMEVCACKGKNALCTACRGRRLVDAGRPYALAFVMDARGAPDDGATRRFRLPENLLALVRATSIRLPPDTAERAPRVAVPRFSFSQQGRAVFPPRAATPAAGGGATTLVPPEDPRAQLIARLVTSSFPGNPIPKKIVRSTTVMAYVVHTQCHHCQNKGGEHAHATVYFVAKPSGIFQRCFCEKTYTHGPCSNYVSPPLKLSAADRDTLFPGFNMPAITKHRLAMQKLLFTD